MREVMELAAALEIESEHPLADAILKFAAETLGQTLVLPGMLLCPIFLSLDRCLQAVKPRVRSVLMDQDEVAVQALLAKTVEEWARTR